MSESASPESGALSVDQAVAILTPEPEAETAPEAPVEAAAEPEEIEAEASPAEEPEAEAENLAEGELEEPAEEAETPLDPPLYWKPEAKDAFASLPPAVQAEILAQEGPREQSASKAKADAAAAIETARKETEGVKLLAEQLSTFLPQAIEAFQTQWGAEEPDWEAVIDEHGVEEAAKFQARYTKHRALLAQTIQAQQATATEARKAELAGELAALNLADPELAPDPKDFSKGVEKRAEVSAYLKASGIPEEAVHLISAAEMVLAKKAMLWDRAQAALKARPTSQPAPAPAARSPVRPAAAVPQSSQRTSLQQAQSRFNLNPTTENAEALLLAQRG